MIVESLYVYPVKSMKGVAVDAVDVTERGIVGDRAYAVIDTSDGKVASAKHPRKWSKLLDLGTAFVEPPSGDAVPPVSIAFPDGTELRSDDDGINAALSAYFGRDVVLTAQPPAEVTLEEVWPDVEGMAPQEFIDATRIGTEDTGEPVTDVAMSLTVPGGSFFDLAALHLLTTSTLGRLKALAPGSRFEPRRFRPNVVVQTSGDGFVENEWPGRTVRIGDAVVAPSIPTMRCAMTTLAQDGLPRDIGVLQTIARNNRIEIPNLGSWACAGVYADVREPGTVRVGDEVVVGEPVTKRP